MELNSKVLVTGASGQIGSRLTRKLVSIGAEVYALSSTNSFVDDSRIKYIRKTWGNPLVEELPEVGIVFHLASQTSAYIARESVARDVETNLLDSVYLIEKLSKQSQPPVVIYAASMTEYGMGQEKPICEDQAVDPQTFYDVGKLALELYLDQFVMEGRLASCTSLRLSNIYGVQQPKSVGGRSFLDRCIRHAIEGENLTIYGDGNYLRDYLHIDDAVEAFYVASKIASDKKINIFNIGTGKGVRLGSALQQVVDGANKLTGKTSRVIQTDFPPGAYKIEKRNSVADPSTFMKITNWKPKIDFSTGLNIGLKQALAVVDANT